MYDSEIRTCQITAYCTVVYCLGKISYAQGVDALPAEDRRHNLYRVIEQLVILERIAACMQILLDALPSYAGCKQSHYILVCHWLCRSLLTIFKGEL